MFGVGSLQILERVAAFCMMSGVVLGLTADNVLGTLALDAVFLPKSFKSKSLPASSLKDLAVGREMEATATAAKAVLKQPLSVEALAALAQSSAVLRPEMSSSALSQAAALGWRNVFVQATVIDSAASISSWSVVAPRVLALASLNELDQIDSAIFAKADVEEYALQIAPTFASNGSAWFKFVKWLGAKGLERERDGLLRQTPHYVDVADCIRLGQIAGEFVSRRQVSIAAELVDSRCQSYLTSASSGAAYDQHFGDSKRGPFEWQMIRRPGVNFSVTTTNSRTRLEIVNSDPLPRTIASKVILAESLASSPKLFVRRLDSVSSRLEPLPISVECAERLANRNDVVQSSVETERVSCVFVRLTFQLPSGHYQMGD